ncbi:HNH endonuclease [Streptomyces albireticuli]|uniref:HNH endonuclease n=1 Tax=Streptomyces albireticuli TaxID=1940 RepID=UPI00367D9027
MAQKRFAMNIWLMVLTANEGICVYCDRAEATELDYVIPPAMGGVEWWTNLAPACISCHQAKSARTPLDWHMSRSMSASWFPAQRGDILHERYGLRAAYEEARAWAEIVLDNVERVAREISDPKRHGWFADNLSWWVPRNRLEIQWSLVCSRPRIAKAKASGWTLHSTQIQ